MASTSGQAQPAKKKPRQPRIDWKDIEIDALIAIWGEPEIQESIEKRTTQKKGNLRYHTDETT